MILTKNIHTGETRSDVARLITERILSVADSHDRPIHVALSGGSTPQSLFEYWLERPDELIRRRIHFWWVDERMVPMAESESNYGNAYRTFFGVANYPRELLHPIEYVEGLTTAEAAERYGVALEQSRAAEARQHALDVVVLGMGDDGHTSSLFPGQDLYRVGQRYIASVNPYNGVERVALSYQGALESPLVLFHVLGSAKRPMLERVLRPQTPEDRMLPAAYVMEQAPVAELYTDIAVSIP